MVAALHAIAFALLGSWMASHLAVPALLVWPLTGLFAAWLGWQAVQPMRGMLRWDGKAWWHGPHPEAARPLHSVDLMMDMGGWMLLRVRAEPVSRRLRPGRWCGIRHADVGVAWHGLRLALYHGRGALAAVAPDRTAG
jgi:hypothetical protein